MRLRLFLFFAFFLAASNALTSYIQSSYLGEFFGQKYIGWIFIFAYVLTFLAINNFTGLINKLKIFKASLLIFSGLTFCLFMLALASQPLVVLAFFLLYVVLLNLSWIALDIYVEYFSRDKITGRIRGLYWTSVHLAWLFSPITSGWILKTYDYSFLFLISGFLALLVCLGFFQFNKLSFDHFASFNLPLALKKIVKNPPLKAIFAITFLLQCFYCVMVVYLPIYLHQYIGFNWQQIGIIFSAMLLNFVLLTYPAGWLADKYLGEKEMMTMGILIMGLATISIGLLRTSSFSLWLITIFLTRVGASLVDILKDSYFFKHVNAHDAQIINLFRSTTSLAYIFMPLLAAAVIGFFGYQWLFIISGLLIFSGLYFSLTLKDTK